MLWARSSELNYPRPLFNSLTLCRSICWWCTACWTLFELQRQKSILLTDAVPALEDQPCAHGSSQLGLGGAPSCWGDGLGLTNFAQFFVTLSISISFSLHSKTLAENLLRKCKFIALAKYSNVLKELLMCFLEVIFQWTGDMLTFYYRPGDKVYHVAGPRVSWQRRLKDE